MICTVVNGHTLYVSESYDLTGDKRKAKRIFGSDIKVASYLMREDFFPEGDFFIHTEYEVTKY